MTDENNELVMINRIGKELLGLADVRDVTVESIGRLESDKNLSSLLRSAFEQGKTLKEEVLLGGKGGKRITVDIVPMIDPNGMKIGTVAVLREL